MSSRKINSSSPGSDHCPSFLSRSWSKCIFNRLTRRLAFKKQTGGPVLCHEFVLRQFSKMDAIKKKMQSLKFETDNALANGERFEREAREQNERAAKFEEQVSEKSREHKQLNNFLLRSATCKRRKSTWKTSWIRQLRSSCKLIQHCQRRIKTSR